MEEKVLLIASCSLSSLCSFCCCLYVAYYYCRKKIETKLEKYRDKKIDLENVVISVDSRATIENELKKPKKKIEAQLKLLISEEKKVDFCGKKIVKSLSFIEIPGQKKFTGKNKATSYVPKKTFFESIIEESGSKEDKTKSSKNYTPEFKYLYDKAFSNPKKIETTLLAGDFLPEVQNNF